MQKQTFLQIEEKDNLVVALNNLTKGTTLTVAGKSIELRNDIPAKHKFTLVDLGIGDIAVMYGVIVGKAMRVITAGELITTENLEHATTAFKEQHEVFTWKSPRQYDSSPQEFMGYRRKNGKAGTANYWIFVPLVFCSNQELNELKKVLPPALG